MRRMINSGALAGLINARDRRRELSRWRAAPRVMPFSAAILSKLNTLRASFHFCEPADFRCAQTGADFN